MPESDSLLAALPRALAAGSRSLTSGLLAALATGILLVLAGRDQVPGGVSIPWIDLDLPPDLALLVLAGGSGVLGMVGWAFLRQAMGGMWDLEFRYHVSPDAIQAALRGSSLISAVPMLFLVASLFVFCWFLAGAFHLSGGPRWILALAAVPYLVLAFSWRLLYLNPDNWDAGAGLLTLLTFLKPGVFQGIFAEVDHVSALGALHATIRKFGSLRVLTTMRESDDPLQYLSRYLYEEEGES